MKNIQFLTSRDTFNVLKESRVANCFDKSEPTTDGQNVFDLMENPL